MPDLSSSYMGLNLRNPVIVGSCDLTDSAEGIARCDEFGAGAVVVKSIFEEQFLKEADFEEYSFAFYPEALDYLRKGSLSEYGAHKKCRMIEEAKKRVGIPVIASINCQSAKLWPRYARQLEDAGADGLELNIYFLPIVLDTPGAEFEKAHLQILQEVKGSVSIPVSVKLSSQITSVPHLSRRLAEAGCAGLVFFNWFLQPDINVRQRRTRNIIGKGDFHQSLRWVALLSGRVGCDVASSGGVRSSEDIIKQVLAGASAIQVCKLFYQKGLKVIPDLLSGIEAWMEEQKYSSVDDFRGELSFKTQELTFKEPEMAEAYFRAQYLKAFLKKR